MLGVPSADWPAGQTPSIAHGQCRTLAPKLQAHDTPSLNSMKKIPPGALLGTIFGVGILIVGSQRPMGICPSKSLPQRRWCAIIRIALQMPFMHSQLPLFATIIFYLSSKKLIQLRPICSWKRILRRDDVACAEITFEREVTVAQVGPITALFFLLT